MKPFNTWRPMKGFLPTLSIQQPWAWLIANGVKDIENRDWKTAYRGPLLLHAGKKLDAACFDGETLHSPPIYQAGGDPDIRGRIPLRKSDYQALTGGIVGICELVDVVEKSNSPWFVGRYGFVLQNARSLPYVEYRGQLGLFAVPESILDRRNIDESTLRAQNIPYVPPPGLDNAYELTQQIAKAEATKARQKVPVDYWTRDGQTQAKIVSDVKSKF